ncbi:MAG: malate synthase G, partial [Proteobacteria bacterium]|nr:malate synthase G [Pseudomonadota bacterium]
MTERITINNLRIARCLHDLVADEIAPGTGINPDDFWHSFAAIVHELGPINQALLEKRNTLQASLDAWHRNQPGYIHDATAYQQFLT